jgi:hypothetical protein
VSRSGPSAGYASCARGRRANDPARLAQFRRYTNAGISATSFAGDHGCRGALEVDVGIAADVHRDGPDRAAGERPWPAGS